MLSCEDCGLLYSEFGLDTTIPNLQWEFLHPSGEGGILCANCMVKRASKCIAGVIAARMVFEVVPGGRRGEAGVHPELVEGPGLGE